MGDRFDPIYARSLADPEGFWADAAEALEWEQRWDRVLDNSRAVLSLVRRRAAQHLLQRRRPSRRDGRGDQLALIYDSPVTDSVRTLTYGELQDQVARFAGALRREGVGRGDRVIIYMPMVPEAVIAMLACARIGAMHSVVFGGFAAQRARGAHRRRQAQGWWSRRPAASSRAA